MSHGASASMRSRDVNEGTPSCAPAVFARSASMSHTAESCMPSSLAIAWKWFLLMRPQPTTATSKVDFVIGLPGPKSRVWPGGSPHPDVRRSEEHTSELQSPVHL